MKLNCDSGFGTATFVTGSFGFAAAAQVVRRIAESSTGVEPNSREKFSST